MYRGIKRKQLSHKTKIPPLWWMWEWWMHVCFIVKYYNLIQWFKQKYIWQGGDGPNLGWGRGAEDDLLFLKGHIFFIAITKIVSWNNKDGSDDNLSRLSSLFWQLAESCPPQMVQHLNLCGRRSLQYKKLLALDVYGCTWPDSTT